MYFSYCFMFLVFILSLSTYVDSDLTASQLITSGKSLPRIFFVKKAKIFRARTNQEVSFSTDKVYTKKHNNFRMFALHKEMKKLQEPNKTEALSADQVVDGDEEMQDATTSNSSYENKKNTSLLENSSNIQSEQTTISTTKKKLNRSHVVTPTRSWLQVLKMYYDPDFRKQSEFKEIKDYVENIYNKEILLNEDNYKHDDDEVEPDEDLEDEVIPYAEKDNSDVNETTCHQCGFDVGWIPTNTNCYDYFEHASNAGGEKHKEMITSCKTTEGCYKGFLDVDHRFVVRGCASTYHYPEFEGTKTYLCGGGYHVCNTSEYIAYIRGKRDYFNEKARSYNQATERYLMLLNLMKTKANWTGRVLEGCVTSPMQVPVKVSKNHDINLFLRHHVCVCQGDYCNTALRIRNEYTMFALVLCLLTYFIIHV